ncbi:hypothetical protein [Intestinibaculum porci]|jgi:hypothetical protein|uniref:Uncharacterized protein n=1 Tax=Intestinibaculum porci TaxID=2487118 RepID=A0A3G9J8L7_9FIRM|nr:hypothetical protein [Intestinibaculum porci]MDD6349548.1 hypothetical protein [Intestinibaculum porci]MDD6422458.1 hypothetical protein [Intestinibaculum porci]BBH27537.1 hypothetical protein SG0102_24710 [Intestinibaculum porci]
MRTLKNELITLITDLVCVLVEVTKKNDPLLSRFSAAAHECLALMVTIKKNCDQAEDKMKNLCMTAYAHMKAILFHESAKSLAQEKEFQAMVKHHYLRRVKKCANHHYSPQEITQLIASANQYCGLIETSDEYSSLKVMISMLESYNKLTYTNISYDLIVQIIALFEGLKTQTIPILDLSGNLYLIHYLYALHSEALEAYTDWYLHP